MRILEDARLGIVVGALTIPIQLILLVVSNAILVRELSLAELGSWYLCLSMLPLFSVLELSLPVILLKAFSNRQNTDEVLLHYLARMVLLVVSVQLIVAVVISTYLFKDKGVFLLFISGVVLRSIGNLLIVFPYAKGYVVLEKVYKFLYSAINPILIFVFVIIFSTSLLENLYVIWFLGSILVTIFSITIIIKTIRKFDVGTFIRQEGKEVFKFEKMKSFKMLLTSLPGLFIFNLSIYYLDYISTELDVAAYGLFLQLLNVFYVINNLIPSVFVPKAMSEFHKSSFNELLEMIIVVTVLLSVSSITFILLNGAPVLSFIFGDSFPLSSYYNITYLLALVICVESIQVALTYISIVTGCFKFYGPSLLSALLVGVGGYFVIPEYGFPGLILVICISQLVTCLPMNLYISIKHLNVKSSRVLFSIVLIFFVYFMIFLITNTLDNYIIKHLIGIVIVIISLANIIRILSTYSKKYKIL